MRRSRFPADTARCRCGAVAISARQYDILTVLCKGYFGTEAAHAMGVSRGTFQNSKRKMMQKYGLQTLVELGAWAATHFPELRTIPE